MLDRDLANNTITVQTDGFSSFVLSVPEPGTIMMLVSGAMLCLLLLVRKRLQKNDWA